MAKTEDSPPELFEPHEPARDERGALRVDRDFSAAEAAALEAERRASFLASLADKFARRSARGKTRA